MNTSLLIQRLSAAYQKVKQIKNAMFGKYLFVTNVGISSSLSGTGDYLQQSYMTFHKKRENWDKERTMNMSLTGMAMGALSHHWYMFLDKKLPGRTLRIVLKKVLLDHIFFSPLIISTFFLTSGLLEKSSLGAIAQEVVDKGKLLYIAECAIWPPAQIINFLFLPTKYRLLYDSVISLGYDVYTSYVKNEVGIEGKNKCEKNTKIKIISKS